jgi:hypothetical protein
MLAGHLMTGGSPSINVTKKKQRFAFSEASVAVHVTRVVPPGNLDPDGGTQTMLVPGQLSVAVAAG